MHRKQPERPGASENGLFQQALDRPNGMNRRFLHLFLALGGTALF